MGLGGSWVEITESSSSGSGASSGSGGATFAIGLGVGFEGATEVFTGLGFSAFLGGNLGLYFALFSWIHPSSGSFSTSEAFLGQIFWKWLY